MSLTSIRQNEDTSKAARLLELQSRIAANLASVKVPSINLNSFK